MLQLYLYTKITRHMNEGTVMLLSLYTGKACCGSCTKLLENFTISFFPKLHAMHQLGGVILSRELWCVTNLLEYSTFSIESEGRNWFTVVDPTIISDYEVKNLIIFLHFLTLSHPEPSDSSSGRNYKLMSKIVWNGLGFGTKPCDAGIFVIISVAILHENNIFKINWFCTWTTKKRNKPLLDSLNFMSFINYLPCKETRQLFLSNKDIRSLPLFVIMQVFDLRTCDYIM